MSEPIVAAVDRLELTFTPRPWPFAEERRSAIDAFFAGLQQENPALWNGRVLLVHRHAFSDGVFAADYFETDYASFMAWRRWAPPSGVRDCFGSAALVSADGAVLLGQMGDHTANPGEIYFPAGTPDPSDIVGGAVDLAASVTRELKEETGIDASELVVEPGWTMVAAGQLIAQIKVLRSRDNADVLAARVGRHLAEEAKPELAGIRFVRSAADFTPAMPFHVTAFLARFFAGGLAMRPASA
jgi:8-oxo-dGTP pyrophosphatase MutT (NUDIX family)